MNATQLLSDLSQRGVEVRPDGRMLRLKPATKLDQQLLAEVMRHKPELLELLVTRCGRCHELQARGVRVLICSTCGYQALSTCPRPTAEDLKVPLAHVRSQVRTLPRIYRDRFDYWMDLLRDAGWSQEEAEKGAFRRILAGPRRQGCVIRCGKCGVERWSAKAGPITCLACGSGMGPMR